MLPVMSVVERVCNGSADRDDRGGQPEFHPLNTSVPLPLTVSELRFRGGDVVCDRPAGRVTTSYPAAGRRCPRPPGRSSSRLPVAVVWLPRRPQETAASAPTRRA